MSDDNIAESYFGAVKLREERDARARARADEIERRNAVADVAPVLKEAGDGVGPSAFIVGKQAYGTEQDAGAAADAYNGQGAKIARLQGVMINQANPDGAMALEKNATDMAAYRRKAADAMQSEGVNDFVDSVFAKAPKLADVESGQAGEFDFNPDDVKKFNLTGGKVKIPDGAKAKWGKLGLGNGRSEVDFSVIGPDGKTLVPSAKTLQLIYQHSASERQTTADSQFKEGADIKLKRDELDSRKKYWEGMVNAATTRADKTGTGGKGASLFDRMDEADKIRLQGLQARAVRIETAMSTAQANGTWDPNSAGAKQLLEQQADVETMVDKIFSGYSTKGASTGDSLGLFQDGGKKGPQQSASGSGQGSDRFKILNAELQQALSRRDGLAAGSAERIRLDEDISALGRELRALPQSERGASAGKSSGSAVKSAQSEGAAKQSAPAGGTQEPQTKLSALKQAQGAANAYRPPLDLRAQVSEAGKSSKHLSAEDLSVLNIINGRK